MNENNWRYTKSRDYENSTEKTVFACEEYAVEVLLIKSSSVELLYVRLVVASSRATKEQEN